MTQQENMLDKRTVHMARGGYSLIEILISIVIIGMLVGGAMYLATTVMENAKRTTTKTALQTIKYSLMGYKQEKGEYPENLQQAIEAGFLKKPLPKDGWGKPFFYSKTEEGIELYSHGPQGKAGGKVSRIKG